MKIARWPLAVVLMIVTVATAWTHAQQRKPSGASSPSTREQTVMVAQTYLEYGMALHEYDRVALAPDIARVEDGWDTGHDSDAVRKISVGFSKGPLWSIRINKWVVQGDQAVSFSDLYGTGGNRLSVAHYFKVAGGNIKELRINF